MCVHTYLLMICILLKHHAIPPQQVRSPHYLPGYSGRKLELIGAFETSALRAYPTACPVPKNLIQFRFRHEQTKTGLIWRVRG